MKTELTRKGTLVVAPETSAEEFALEVWVELNAKDLPPSMLVLVDRGIDINEAASINDEAQAEAAEG
jgi:hypothetical protein